MKIRNLIYMMVGCLFMAILITASTITSNKVETTNVSISYLDLHFTNGSSNNSQISFYPDTNEDPRAVIQYHNASGIEVFGLEIHTNYTDETGDHQDNHASFYVRNGSGTNYGGCMDINFFPDGTKVLLRDICPMEVHSFLNMSGTDITLARHMDMAGTLTLNSTGVGSNSPSLQIIGGVSDTRLIDYNSGRAKLMYNGSSASLDIKAMSTKNLRLFANAQEAVLINQTGLSVKINNLSGVGNMYVCVDSNGELYRNTTCG